MPHITSSSPSAMMCRKCDNVSDGEVQIQQIIENRSDRSWRFSKTQRCSPRSGGVLCEKGGVASKMDGVYKSTYQEAASSSMLVAQH